MEELRLDGWQRVETHISVVLLGPTEVLKRKKPVQLGFLDFSTLALRREACEAELRLNRRLAPDVYLSVDPIRRDAAGGLTLEGDGEIVDYAVRMRRLPDSERADVLLAQGALDEAALGRVAAHIARFHRDAETSPEISRFGAPATVEQNVAENFEQTRGVLSDYLGKDEAEELEAYQRDFVSHRALFVERVARGHVRDGHGDLRLEHLYIDASGTIRIIDCIEFNERFRYQDVAADIAFLAMDLARSGAPRLAEVFVGAYAEAAQDYDLYPLLDFYESYRAFVRGKVATMLARDEGASRDARDRAEASARQAFLLSLASGRTPLAPPQVIAVGGFIASGKSTLAASLAAAIGAPHINSDRTRKHLAGVEPDTSLAAAGFADAYTFEATQRVYDELGRRAELVLRSGRPVVLDATFPSAALRAQARSIAEAAGVPFVFIECQAPRAVLEARLRAREGCEGVVSDARIELLDDFIARFEPVDEAREGRRYVADTAGALDDALGPILEAVFDY